MSQFLNTPAWVKRMWDEIQALKSRVNAISTGNAEIIDGGPVVGLPRIHTHAGTSEAGRLDAENVDLPAVGTPTFSTVEDLQTVFHSAGWVEGGVISDAGGETIDISVGDGALRISDSVTAQIVFFDWAALSAQAIPTDTTRYVGVEYNSGSPQAVIHTSYDWNFNTDFPLGNVVNEGGDLHIENSPFEIGNHADLMNQRLFQTLPRVRDNLLGGLIVGETGTRNVTLSAGALWDGLSRFPISAIDTSVSGGFDTYSAGGKEATAATQWPNDEYDNAGTLTALSNNRYANLWWYLELDGGLIMLYGTNQYTSAALAGEETPPTTLPDRVTVQSRLVARFIFQEGAATALEKLSAFTTVFATTGVTDHGNLAGLADDDHSQYALLTGRANDKLTLLSDATETVLEIIESGDANSRLSFGLASDLGFINFGAGGATAIDVTLFRAIANELRMAAGDTFRADTLLTDTINEITGAGGVTIDGLLIKDGGIPATLKTYSVQVFPPGVTTATGDGKAFWNVPPEVAGMNLVYVHLRVFTVGTTGVTSVAIRRVRGDTPGGASTVDVLSTNVTVDSGEFGSHSAATPAVIKSDGSEGVLENDGYIIDMDAVNTTEAIGASLTVSYQLP